MSTILAKVPVASATSAALNVSRAMLPVTIERHEHVEGELCQGVAKPSEQRNTFAAVAYK